MPRSTYLDLNFKFHIFCLHTCFGNLSYVDLMLNVAAQYLVWPSSIVLL